MRFYVYFVSAAFWRNKQLTDRLIDYINRKQYLQLC